MNLIFYHDKLLEYGGAEVVLECLVEEARPKKIYTTCMSNRKYWEGVYNTVIEAPAILSFIKTQKQYRIFYPLICVVAFFCKPSELRGSTLIVYSSTAAKFLSVSGAKKIILYTNYPAKPLLKLNDYFQDSSYFKLLSWLLKGFIFFWKRFELVALYKFEQIVAISESARTAYHELYGLDKLPKIDVFHCPVKNVVFSYTKTTINGAESLLNGVLISRLYPEKNLESLLSYIAGMPNVALTVIGDGPLFEYFSSKYEKKINFTGFMEEENKLKVLSESDFMLFPTQQEWSLVTVEANILGVPVIGVESDAIKEINIAASGCQKFPNLSYTRLSEIPDLLNEVQDRRILLRSLQDNYLKHFSASNLLKYLNSKL